MKNLNRTPHPIATRILGRLIGEDVVDDCTLADGVRLITAELDRDHQKLKERYTVLSTGEKTVALAWLYRCDYAGTADEWSGGFLGMLSYTGGAHKAACLDLISAC